MGVALAYRVEEVAEILQVSTDTVRRLIRSGRLEQLDLGVRQKRISHVALQRFLEGR